MAPSITPRQNGNSATRFINRAHAKQLYGFHFDRFVCDESNFSPQDRHRTIEIEETTDRSSNLRLLENEISESDISR
jgi:hypothetical protein